MTAHPNHAFARPPPRVPTGTLFRSGAQWTVYAIDRNACVRRVPIQIAHRGALFTELFSGLSEGARVVLYPGDTIRDGVRVTPAAGL